MPTGQQALEDRAWVNSQGFSARILEDPQAKGDWYRPDGLVIPGLPVDAYHRELYRGKGWTLKPPTPDAIAAWKASHPESTPVGVDSVAASLSPELEKELAEITGAVEQPPKHVHVYQEAIGSPCLVVGCRAVRVNPKTKWKGKDQRRS